LARYRSFCPSVPNSASTGVHMPWLMVSAAVISGNLAASSRHTRSCSVLSPARVGGGIGEAGQPGLGQLLLERTGHSQA
jgi:hypothetical protein